MKRTALLTTALFLLSNSGLTQPCALPARLFGSDTLIQCAGTSLDLQGPLLAGAVYEWSTTETTDHISVGVNGRYWLTVRTGACTVSDTVTVLFNSFLLSPPVNDRLLCKGQPALPITVSGQQVQWYTGPIGGTGQSGGPLPSTADTGRVTYWFSQTILGCESPRVPMLVRVIDKPHFELGDAFIIPCGSPGVTLQVVEDEFSNYHWSNGSTGVSMVASTRGQYSLYAENQCGNYRDSTVAVECQDKCVQFPTAFTPNGDGINEVFRIPPGSAFQLKEFSIFDRWGNKVFATSDITKGWDGTFKGTPQDPGVYHYIVRLAYPDGKVETYKGDVTLLR